MGISSERREAWASSKRTTSFPIDSPEEQGVLGSKRSVQEATVSGFRNAAIAGAVAAGPVIIGCRLIPWAKANLNYTAQALLISSGAYHDISQGYTMMCVYVVNITDPSIAAFFITADKTILERAKQNSRTKFNKTS